MDSDPPRLQRRPVTSAYSTAELDSILQLTYNQHAHARHFQSASVAPPSTMRQIGPGASSSMCRERWMRRDQVCHFIYLLLPCLALAVIHLPNSPHNTRSRTACAPLPESRTAADHTAISAPGNFFQVTRAIHDVHHFKSTGDSGGGGRGTGTYVLRLRSADCADIVAGGGLPQAPSGNRTLWPYQGGALSVQPGWFPGHSKALFYVNIGIIEAGDLAPPNYSHPVVPPFQITGPTNLEYEGQFCLPQVPMPANLSLQIGDNITLQVIETAQHGAALYSLGPRVQPGVHDCRSDLERFECVRLEILPLHHIPGGDHRPGSTAMMKEREEEKATDDGMVSNMFFQMTFPWPFSHNHLSGRAGSIMTCHGSACRPGRYQSRYGGRQTWLAKDPTHQVVSPGSEAFRGSCLARASGAAIRVSACLTGRPKIGMGAQRLRLRATGLLSSSRVIGSPSGYMQARSHGAPLEIGASVCDQAPGSSELPPHLVSRHRPSAPDALVRCPSACRLADELPWSYGRIRPWFMTHSSFGLTEPVRLSSDGRSDMQVLVPQTAPSEAVG
nr:hypothetical protein CFP56_78112 [Quercus suber]